MSLALSRRTTARPRGGRLRLLAPLALACLWPSLPAAAGEPEWIRLEAVLARVEVGEPALQTTAGARARPTTARAGSDELLGLTGALAQDVQRHRARFDRAAALDLPPRARERLAAARAAYEGGQGRLLDILQTIGSAKAGDSPETLAREAREIVSRLSEASRRPPLSSDIGGARVRAPRLRPKPLPQGEAGARNPRTTLAAVEPPPPEALEGTGGSSSPEAIPAPIQTLAQGLAGPVDVYAWVRNNVKPEFYDGVMKGALQTFLEGSGNDADTTALLVALLRAKAVPARFVEGTVEVTAARLMAVTGTTSPEQAVRVLERAGIAHEPVLGPGGIATVKMARVWAEAYVPYANYRGAPVDAQGKVWVPLDAGFKELVPPKGFDSFQALALDVPALMDEYLSGPKAETPREFVKQRVTTGLLAQGKTYESAQNDRSPTPESLGILPNTLPYAVVARGEVEYGLPETLRHGLRIRATRQDVTLLDATLDVPDVLGGRLTLAYAPFDEEDDLVVKQFGGLTHTPPYLVDLRVILRKGGVGVAAGDAPIGAGVVYDLALDFSHPGGTETVTNRMTAGNLTAIGLGGREVTGSEPDQSRAAQILSRLAWTYLDRWNKSDAELADLFRVVPVRPTVSLCMVLSAIQVEYAGGDPLYPLSFDWKGVAIDADLRSTAPVGVETPEAEARFVLYSGLEGSILENAVLESDLGVESVSTAKALQLAGQQGIPILDLDRDAAEVTVPGLPFVAQVKDEVLEGARRGFVVRIPENLVTHLAWTGVGYRILDPETGEAAYQLQGGHSGGITAPSTLEWPTDLRDILEDQGEAPAPLDSKVARISKLVTTDFQEQYVDKELERPLRALVTTAEGLRRPGASVTFTVLGGGGTLKNPLTQEESTSEMTVLADLRGVAAVGFKLGQKTNEIPRYVCREETECLAENDFYATQVGLNMVTASAGPAQLAEPFFAYGLPDDQCPEELKDQGAERCGYVSVKPIQLEGVTQLRVGGAIFIDVHDSFKNPISNFRVDVAFLPPPLVGKAPPGWEVAREKTDTEGHVLRARDYVRCAAARTHVRYGECEGEKTELSLWTSAGGAAAYPVLGDSPYSAYFYGVGAIGGAIKVAFGTHGVICTPSCDGVYRQPMVMADIVGRPVLVNRKGQVIEAYAPGSTADLRFAAEAVYEGYVIEPSTDDKGKIHYAIRGNNTWTREPIDDSEILLSSSTAGAEVPDTANGEGDGVFSAEMSISETPQLNVVDYEARLVPLDIPYLKDKPLEVDPAYVDPGTLQVQKVQFPDFPRIRKGSTQLWGVEPVAESVEPSPVRIADGRTVGKSLFYHSIKPDGYPQLLEPEWVRFDLSRDGQPVLSAFGNDVDPFEIPANLPFPPGDYTATLSILGVSKGESPNLVSAPAKVTASALLELLTPVVVLPYTANPPAGTTCATQDRMVFTLGEQARVTVKAKPTVSGVVTEQTLVGGVDGGAPTPVQDLLLEAGQHQILVPQDTLAGLSVATAPFVLKAGSTKLPVISSEKSGVLASSGELLTLEGNPRLTIPLIVDTANDSVCSPNPPSLIFAVCVLAQVTLLVDGQPLEAPILHYTDPPSLPVNTLISDLPLVAGQYQVFIPAGVLGPSLNDKKPYSITAVSLEDPAQATTKSDFIQNDIQNRGVLSVGRTFVKGVDLYDGHVVAQETDLSLPGRHLGLEVTRTYSSAGKSPEGQMGAGWHWTYEAGLWPADGCGLVSLSTADGSSQVFKQVAPDVFVPQKGYHGRLLRLPGDSYEYIDKAGNRHRFVNELSQGKPGHYVLAYTEEPHGDRIELRRTNGRLAEVAEVQGGVDVRKLLLTWEKVGTDRLKTVEAVRADGTPLRLRVEYEHDKWGNLVKAMRDGRNAEGVPAEERVHKYAYSTTYERDRFQLLQAIGPNGERRDYEYFAQDDSFPGDQPGALRVFMEKDEFVRRVREFPSGELTTVFSYDLQEALANRWKTTVTDPRGIKSLYVLNSNGSPVEIREALDRPEGRLTTMKWKAADVLKEEETDANGRLTRYEYDPRGNLTKETIVTADLGDLVTEYAYDPSFNKLTSKIDAEGRTTTYIIDPAKGDLVEMTDAVGNQTQYAYTSAGLFAQVTDPRGHATLHQDHDDYGNALTVVDPLGNATRRRYDPRGRLAEETDDFGRRREVEYDGLDRPVVSRRVTGGDSTDEVIRRKYYPGGQVRVETNAGGATTVFVLDGLNRVVATQTTVEGDTLTTATEYDANGNKIKEKDRRDVWRNFAYDGLNRLTRVTLPTGPAASPTGEIATYGYDAVGNKLFETDVAHLRTDFVYDGLYRVSQKILPEGPTALSRYEEVYGYDKVGNRTSFTDANLHVTTSEYDGLNRLVRTVRDPLGLSLETTVTYSDPEGSKVNKSEELDVQRGLRTFYLYDSLNRVTRKTVRLEGEDGDPATDAPEYVTETTYDDSNHAMTVVDPRGTAIFRRMDGLDRLAEEVVDAGGSGLRLRTTMAYDGLGNRKRVTDPRGNSTLYDFDGLGRLRTMTDAQRRDTVYEHDGEGLKTAETDRRGVTRRFGHDNLGRPLRSELLASISAVPWSQEIEYRDQDLQRLETDARGNKTTHDLDRLGRVVRVTDPDNKVKTLEYDGVNKVAESDKRGNVTRFKYDAVNRVVKVTDPAPFQTQTVETTYEDAANRVREKDRNDILRITQLDPLGRTRSVTRAGIPLERHEYDGDGNRIRSLDAESRETRFSYDPANRLSARTDGFGTPVAATTRFRYDGNGNLTEELDPRSAAAGDPFSVRKAYDELNRLISMTDALGNTTRYGYDPEGNRTSLVEPKGQTTAFEYEELGKLTKVTQPKVDVAGEATAPVTTYEYDAARNRVRQTDANGHAVAMAYDKLNRLASMTQDPGGLGLVTSHEYDAQGNEKLLRDPKGQVVTSAYDELNRLRTKAYAFAAGDPYRPWRRTQDITYGYDKNGNVLQVDETVASGNDPPDTETKTTLREYDDLDRLKKEITPLPDGGTREVAYTYYANGTRKTITDPAGRVTEYTYDGQNRLATATTDFDTPDARLTTYTYLPDDLLDKVTYPNGVVAIHGYDKADRLTSLANAGAAGPVSSYVYGYDQNSNRTSQLETNGLPAPKTENTTYTYDALNRLASVSYPEKVVTYGYDAVGNRTRETETDVNLVVLADKQGVFDNVNRLLSLTDAVGPVNNTTFTWDPNGNQLTKTTGGKTTEYRYDVRDKLVEVQRVGDPVPIGRFQYDFQGRRNKKIGEGLPGDTIRQYVYDQTSLLAEYNVLGTQVAKYDYGSDRLISLFRQDEGRRYFSFDGLGSVVSLTDDPGITKASYHLDAFGQYRFPTELNQSNNRFGLTGHYFDRETNLYFAQARYLDPQLGRFINQDSFLGSIDNPPSLHRFFYANDNPLRYVDPSGHLSLDLSLLQKGYEAVRLVAQSAYGAYETAKQQVVARQGMDLQDPYGLRDLAIGAQMLRNAQQASLDRTAGQFGSTLNAASGGFVIEAAAGALEMPSNAVAGLTNLALPGGAAMWQGREPTEAELAYAPARRQQVAGLKAALSPSLSLPERAAHGFAAVATTPVVVIEGLTWGAGGKASDAVGKEVYKAATAPTLTDAGLHVLEAGQQAATAFTAFGSLVAPFVPKAKLPSSAAAPENPLNLSTAGKTPQEAAATREYARRTNEWLEQQGPQVIQPTKGALRRAASAAARQERLRAARTGQPYQGQAGHVPDAAISGQAQPPAGWLDMPGTSNPAAGGALGSRLGKPVDVILIDGKKP